MPTTLLEGGSDARVEEALQWTVRTVQESLQDIGQRCSPSKTELLLYRPKEGPSTEKRSDRNKISVYTKRGTVIPRVADIRMQEMLNNEHGGDGNTVTWVIGKAANVNEKSAKQTEGT